MMRKIARILIVVMSVIMGVFALAACQTLEYTVDNGYNTPWQVYAVFGVVLLWCVFIPFIPRSDIKEIDRFFTDLTD